MLAVADVVDWVVLNILDALKTGSLSLTGKIAAA
jgi:hypothetical protein